MAESQILAVNSDQTRESPANSLALQQTLGPKSTNALRRMFRDPRVLDSDERADLIASLAKAVECLPDVPEIRVMLGMALCVDLRAQAAMAQLRETVERNPDCYIAQLKLGELLMRLRICDQATEHTHRAAVLAVNDVQSELARRQAATIRQMQREGIERGGYCGGFSWVKSLGRRRSSQSHQPALVVSE